MNSLSATERTRQKATERTRQHICSGVAFFSTVKMSNEQEEISEIPSILHDVEKNMKYQKLRFFGKVNHFFFFIISFRNLHDELVEPARPFGANLCHSLVLQIDANIGETMKFSLFFTRL